MFKLKLIYNKITKLPILLAISALGYAEANLLVNGDFSNWENPRKPVGWTVEDTTKARVEQESGTVRSTPYASKITRLVTGTGNNYGLRQYVNVTPGNVYTFSAWFYDDDINARGGLLITWCRQDTSAIRSTSVVYTDSAIRTWQRLSRTDTAPDSAALARCLLRIYGFTGGPAGGIVYVDDAEFIATSGSIGETAPESTLGQRSITVLSHGPESRIIRLSMNNSGYTELAIYDHTGREMARLFSGYLGPGIHSFPVDLGKLPSGVAFAVARGAGEFPLVTKLVINH